MYALITNDEDANFIMVTDNTADALEKANDMEVEQFQDASWFKANSEPRYWPDGIAVLIKLEVLKPQPVTSEWRV